MLMDKTSSMEPVSPPESPRREIDLGFGWLFAFGSRQDATEPKWFDDNPNPVYTPWRPVDLPHDFQFSQPWDANAGPARGYKAMGCGWYRRRIFADEAWRGRRVSIDFGGIICQSEVWLNGVKIAEDDYGYLGFEVDVADRLRWGEENVIAVMASTGDISASRWYTGGGLYRGVKLVVRDAVSVSRHGVFVTTPVATPERAEVDVEVEIDGIGRSEEDLDVSVRILAPDGREVGAASALAPKDSRLRRTHVLVRRIVLNKPQLWDLDSPSLYVAEVSLLSGGQVIDRIRRRFGVRSIEFGPSFGFRLNGRKIFLRGMSNHHDHGPLGAADYPRAIERRFRVMKAFGFNAVRCSHNPYSEEFLDLADELGLLVVDEVADKWSGDVGVGRPFIDRFFPLVTEWVRRDRNHPSVILWSLGNELQQNELAAGFQTDDFGVTSYRILDMVVKRWDPTRLTTVAMYPARDGGIQWHEPKFKTFTKAPALAFATDIASFNYQHDQYGEYLRQKPDTVIFQSEAAVRDLLAPYWGMDRERTVGLSYWGAIEYWGESPGWPAKGWTHSFFNHDLSPRPSAWLLKSVFLPDEPVARLAVFDGEESRIWNDVRVGSVNASENWNRKPGDVVRLVAFTNAEEAEVFLNGRSLGTRRNDAPEGPDRNILFWENVAWEPGRVEVVARSGGMETARHALETSGPAVRLVAEPEPGRWLADGRDLLYVRVRAVDSEGRTAPADAEVRVKVSGPARLVALDDGDHATNELFDVSSKRLRGGMLQAIIRAGREPGEVEVSFEADGLQPAKLAVALKIGAKFIGGGVDFGDGGRKIPEHSIPPFLRPLP